MLVKTLLEGQSREVITTNSWTSIDEAMDLLIENNIGCLPVIEGEGKLIGIVSDKDIFRKIHETKGDYHSLQVSDVMSTNLLIGLPEDELDYVASMMSNNWIRHVPIVESDKIIGLISARDIIKAEHHRTTIENRYLNMYVSGLGTRDHSAD